MDLGTRTTSAASHLALWASLYVTGAVVCFGQVAGIGFAVALDQRHAVALAYAFSTAAAVYLLDRVKVRDRWLDPADREAHPNRHEFLARNAPKVRALAA